MRINKFLFAVFLMGIMHYAHAKQDPLSLIKETADKVLEEVIIHKASLENKSADINILVDKHVLPHFDFKRMTQSAMGKYWRRASQEQKNTLVKKFRELLVRTYGVALLNYSGQQIVYLPVRKSEDENRVIVQTRVAEANGGPEIPVDYRLYFQEEAWKVYDVIIDGISLVSNYRTSFSGQIRRSGIDGLIKELESHNQDSNGAG